MREVLILEKIPGSSLDHPLLFTDQAVQFTVIVFLSFISTVAIAALHERITHACGNYLNYETL